MCNQKRPENWIRYLWSQANVGKMWSYKNSEKAPLFEVKSPFNHVSSHYHPYNILHFLFGRRGISPTGYSHHFWILSGTQGETWNIRRKATLLFKERVQKMLSLCEKLYLKQDRNLKCPRKGYQVIGGISKGGREAFHIEGCCDAFYLQYWDTGLSI